MSDFGSDPRFLGAMAAASASLAIFAGGKIFELWREGRDKRRNERRLVNALYTEIRHNREELRKSLEVSLPTEIIVARMKEHGIKSVYATYSRNTKFFDDMRGDLHVLPQPVLEAAVRFYNSLESIYAIMDSLGGESFKEMTLPGKQAALEHLLYKIESAIRDGGEAVNQFEIRCPQLYGSQRPGITRPRAEVL